MAEMLTELAMRMVRDRATLRSSITTPMVVWQAPSEPHPDESWEHTDAGVSRDVRPRTGNPLVFRVEKRAAAANAFAMAVTIGRIDSNDVQIDESSVSRFHAYLQKDPKTGLWLVTDAESNNGTYLEGVKLAPNVKTPVPDGARLTVGEAELRFFLPEAFLVYLEHPSP